MTHLPRRISIQDGESDRSGDWIKVFLDAPSVPGRETTSYVLSKGALQNPAVSFPEIIVVRSMVTSDIIIFVTKLPVFC